MGLDAGIDRLAFLEGPVIGTDAPTGLASFVEILASRNLGFLGPARGMGVGNDAPTGLVAFVEGPAGPAKGMGVGNDAPTGLGSSEIVDGFGDLDMAGRLRRRRCSRRACRFR